MSHCLVYNTSLSLLFCRVCKPPEVYTRNFYNRAFQLQHLCPVDDIFGHEFTGCLLHSPIGDVARAKQILFAY